MERKRRIKKRWIVLGSIVVLLVGVYLALPHIILRYANKVLSEMEGYQGHIDDVDLHLYKGAYEIDGLVIKKIDANVPKPFINIPKTHLAIEWPAIFNGKIVGEIVLRDAELNFVGGGSEKDNQTGVENDWTAPIKKLMPLKINKFEIINGKITYNDFTSKPKVNLFIQNLRLVATNLNNAAKAVSNLPSTLKITGSSIGKGDLNIEGKLNILKKIPDVDLEMKFTSVALTSLNDFTKAYGKFDFEKGSMSLFSEIAVAEGNFDGYIKPILTDVKISNLKEKDEGVFKKVWEGILEVTEKVLENPRKEQFATKAPIKGSVGEVKTKVIPTMLNILKNAFIKAFSETVDDEISFDDAKKVDDKNSKKEDRKEKRKEKKEERKEKREEKKEEKEMKKEEKENQKEEEKEEIGEQARK